MEAIGGLNWSLRLVDEDKELSPTTVRKRRTVSRFVSELRNQSKLQSVKLTPLREGFQKPDVSRRE